MRNEFAQQHAAFGAKKPAETAYYDPNENRYPKWLYASGGKERLVQTPEEEAPLVAAGWQESQVVDVAEVVADIVAAGDEPEPGPMLSEQLAELARLRVDHPALQAKHAELVDDHANATEAHLNVAKELEQQAAQFDRAWSDLKTQHEAKTAELAAVTAALDELQARHNGLLAEHEQLQRTAAQAPALPLETTDAAGKSKRAAK